MDTTDQIRAKFKAENEQLQQEINHLKDKRDKVSHQLSQERKKYMAARANTKTMVRRGGRTESNIQKSATNANPSISDLENVASSKASFKGDNEVHTEILS